MSKHTPGPWYVNSHPFDNQPEYILAKTGRSGDDCRDVVGVAIAERSMNVLSGWRPKEEALANAHLIAAAPELLESLKSLVGYQIASARDHALRQGKKYAEPIDVTLAKQAIARAEGRS